MNGQICIMFCYNGAINQNQSITPIEKLTFLLSCLKGEPLNLINGLPVTLLNYHIAFDAVQKRYQNVRRLINLHITKIIDLPPVSVQSLHNIRSFVDTYIENAQALKALDHDIGRELTLTTILLRNLDSELRKRFEDKCTLIIHCN